MIKTVCVCGAGTMGTGIAQAAAQHGFDVVLYDLSISMLQQSILQIEKNLQSLVDKQKISPAARKSILAQLRFENSLQRCKADLIIEAVVEKAEVKYELFRNLAAVNDPETIFASNTSSLSITEIARQHPSPRKVAGLHFFNPATIMKLVEVIETEFSDEDMIRELMTFSRDLGKTPVLCRDSPGFIVNRVARPYYIEALRLAEEGVPYTLIDQLMESAGFKLGPFSLMDLIGNDVNYAVSCSVYEQLGRPERLRPSEIQQRIVTEGKLGRKSGAGYYTY